MIYIHFKYCKSTYKDDTDFAAQTMQDRNISVDRTPRWTVKL